MYRDGATSRKIAQRASAHAPALLCFPVRLPIPVLHSSNSHRELKKKSYLCAAHTPVEPPQCQVEATCRAEARSLSRSKVRTMLGVGLDTCMPMHVHTYGVCACFEDSKAIERKRNLLVLMHSLCMHFISTHRTNESRK